MKDREIIAAALRCYLQEQRQMRERLNAEMQRQPMLYEIKVLIEKFTTQEQVS